MIIYFFTTLLLNIITVIAYFGIIPKDNIITLYVLMFNIGCLVSYLYKASKRGWNE